MIKHRPISKTTQETIKTAFKLTQEYHLGAKEGDSKVDKYRAFLNALHRIPDHLYNTYYTSVREIIKQLCDFNAENGTDLETTIKQIDKILNILINKEL